MGNFSTPKTEWTVRRCSVARLCELLWWEERWRLQGATAASLGVWACGNGSSSEDQSWLVVSKLPIDSYFSRWWKHVKTTNQRDDFVEDQRWLRGSFAVHETWWLGKSGTPTRWLEMSWRRCRIGSTIALRLGTSWRMHATTGGPGLSSLRKRWERGDVASALRMSFESLRLQHLPFSSVTWRPGNGQSAKMIFPHVFHRFSHHELGGSSHVQPSQRMAAFWIGCARNGN